MLSFDRGRACDMRDDRYLEVVLTAVTYSRYWYNSSDDSVSRLCAGSSKCR